MIAENLNTVGSIFRGALMPRLCRIEFCATLDDDGGNQVGLAGRQRKGENAVSGQEYVGWNFARHSTMVSENPNTVSDRLFLGIWGWRKS